MQKTVLLIVLTSTISFCASPSAFAGQEDGSGNTPLKADAHPEANKETASPSSASDKEAGRLKGAVTFSEKSASDAGLQSAAGSKEGGTQSGTNIPPGWVVVGENSRGEVRYGPPDTTSNTNQQKSSSVPGDSKRTGLLDVNIKTLPPTRLDPFILPGGPELIYGDEGSPLPPAENFPKIDNGR